MRAGVDENIVALNQRFQLRSGYIEVCRETVFQDTPSALLEIFVLCGQHESIEGIHAATIRLIREQGDLIDDDFRSQAGNRALFMELLSSPNKLARQYLEYLS